MVSQCIKRNLLVLSCGPYDTVRLIPPLNITSDELKQTVGIFNDAMIHVAKHGLEH